MKRFFSIGIAVITLATTAQAQWFTPHTDAIPTQRTRFTTGTNS